MKNSIELSLLGQKIVLKSAGDPADVQEIVALASACINGAEKRGKSKAPHHVALLALLDLAEEYVQAKKRATDLKKLIDHKSHEMLGLVEAEFK